MSNNLHDTLRTSLTTRGLLVEAIDQDLVTRTIDGLTPAQRWMIRLRFGLTRLPPMTLEEISELMGDKNPNSVEKILKDGMNSLSFKVAMTIRAGDKPAPEPDPEDGLVRLDGNVANDEELFVISRGCEEVLPKIYAGALADAGIKFIGELIQRTKEQVKTTSRVGRKGLVWIEERLRQGGLSLGSKVTGWQRPTTPE